MLQVIREFERRPGHNELEVLYSVSDSVIITSEKYGTRRGGAVDYFEIWLD